MVSIVGGSELGVNTNSGRLLGGRGELGEAGQGRSGDVFWREAAQMDQVNQLAERVRGLTSGPTQNIYAVPEPSVLSSVWSGIKEDLGDQMAMFLPRRGGSKVNPLTDKMLSRLDEQNAKFNIALGVGPAIAGVGTSAGKSLVTNVGEAASALGYKLQALSDNILNIGRRVEDVVPNSARAEIVSEANARSAYLSDKYGSLTSEQRMVRIDELSSANYNRILANDLSQQDYVYRLVKGSDLKYYEAANSISGRAAGSPTYFSLDTAGTIPEHMLGAQMKPAGYDTVLRIPVRELVNPSVPRPFGYEPVGVRPTIGREYLTNSYPDYGSGGFRQFEATTKSFDSSWIYRRAP